MALSFLLLSVPANADPFSITAGVLGFSAGRSVVILNFSGPDFAIPIGDSNPEEFGLPGLAIGTADPLASTFPVSGHIFVDLSAPLTLVNGGVPDGCCRRVILDLTFAGNPVASRPTTIPPGDPMCFDGCFALSGDGSFTVTGTISAFSDDFETPVLLRQALVGRGAARVGFALGDDQPPRAFALYAFEAAPTPEPGTLLLFVSGGLGLLTQRRRGLVRR